MKVHKQFSINDLRTGIEHVDHEKPHMTVPNAALTVREIIERFTSGEKIDGREVRYDIWDDLSDEDALSLEDDDDNPDELTSFQELTNKILENESKKRTQRRQQQQEDERNKESTTTTTISNNE